MMGAMPDRRRHRGPHPEDGELFAPEKVPTLRTAVRDMSWLLSRSYASPSSLKLVGDRYELTDRQRTAVARSACSDDALGRRVQRWVAVRHLAGEELLVDGYNLLITIESALAGGVVLAGRDTTYRDLASMHGSYRTMEETLPALGLIGQALAELDVPAVRWLLDAPVSNSGRLRAAMLELAAARRWRWSVDLVADPDKELAVSGRIIVTSDSAVLDAGPHWANLARHVVDRNVPDAWVIDLG